MARHSRDPATPSAAGFTARPIAIRTALVLALAGSSAAAETFRARVAAGPHRRVDVPVSVEVRTEAGADDPAVVRAGGRELPAQLEELGEGSARIWWVVGSLERGEERVYEVKVGARPEGPLPWTAFHWVPSSTGDRESTDLRFGDSPVVRYMHTPFDPEAIEATKKVFHHVWSPAGSRFITQGLGGDPYPHHRGIYFGYNSCRIQDTGETVDVWHAARGEHQAHGGELRRIEGPVVGGHVVRVLWNDREGRTFAEEERRVVFYRQRAGHRLIELSTVLRAAGGPVTLAGDRQHAGVQFRASPWVAAHSDDTRYLRPEEWKDLPPGRQVNTEEHRDLPWNAIRFRIEDQPYTVAYLTDPRNPDGAAFSERLYGRFGEYFPWELDEDRPLRARYRWWIAASHEPTRADVRERYEALAHPPQVELVD